MSTRSDFELDQRAAEAKAILNNPIFKEAVDILKDTFLEQLVSAKVGSPEAQAAHALSVALNEVLKQLTSVINDQKMASRKGIRYNG